MKANELRIGNYVNDSIGLITIGLNGNIKFADVYHPIPLTEEWLLKFGFLYSLRLDDFMFKKGNDCFEIQPYKEGFLNSVLYNDIEILDRLQHVHQLQNLYFALTGEELTIDEQLKYEQSKE
jgi:hypothetical protein